MKTRVEAYLEQSPRWQPLIEAIRELLLPLDLAEDIVGAQITYTYQERDVASLESFQDFLALNFPKGVLLEDRAGVLHSTSGASMARRFEFHELEEIEQQKASVVAFINQAIAHERAGVAATSQDHVLRLAPDLLELFDREPDVEAAFYRLNPEVRQAYQSQLDTPADRTERVRRLEQMIPRILAGLAPDGKDV